LLTAGGLPSPGFLLLESFVMNSLESMRPPMSLRWVFLSLVLLVAVVVLTLSEGLTANT